MTLNVKLARDGETLEKHGTTSLRAPTDSTRRILLDALFPTAASVAAEEDDDEEEEEDDEDDDDEEEEDDEEEDDEEEDAP